MIKNFDSSHSEFYFMKGISFVTISKKIILVTCILNFRDSS